jgi:Ankyrin repeats (3 copies)
MIMALQTLGYQNSGQWQDAQSVAMHILGNQNQGMGGMSGTDDLSNTDISSMLGGPYNFASGANSTSRRASSRESKKIEDVVLRVLRSAQHPVTGVISQISTPHPVTGQTLLHLASALGLSKLVWALIRWKANVLIPDKNGFSPVHFACFYGRTECVEILVRVGRAHLEGCDVTGRTPLDVCGTDAARELVLELEEEVETRKRQSRIGSEVESGGDGDDEGQSWSESDGDDDEDEDQEPTKVSGAEAPQPVSRRISRVNSMVSIASRKGISRAGTPYLVDDILPPMTPMHPNPATTLVPPSPASSWALARNISMPWRAGWQLPQLPNVPAMPQFVQRRGDARQQKHRVDDSQEEKEQMFKWMMWMDTARKMWQAQQQQQTTIDIDPPPSYSPTGATSVSGPPCEKSASNAVTTPAAPTALDEPPSPLSLDSPYSTGAAIAGPLDPHGHHLSRQRQPSYQRQVADPSNDVLSVSAPTPTVVVKRKTKTRDTMLIYFWIPVLLCESRPSSYRPPS